MVFDYAEHDLTGLMDANKYKFTEAQVRAGVGAAHGVQVRRAAAAGPWREQLGRSRPGRSNAAAGRAAGSCRRRGGLEVTCPVRRACVRGRRAQVKCIMKQLLKGLAYVHGNGVLHRDLKVSEGREGGRAHERMSCRAAG